MKIFIRIFVLVLSLTLVLTVGCSDRGTNGGDDDGGVLAEGGPLEMTHIFAEELLFQLKNDYHFLEMVAYRPKVNFDPISGGELKSVPMLVLLAPQGKDQYFYFNHGLEELADELIATGQIQPMLIVCVSNDLTFGGYFYGSHYPAAGNYDAILGGSLLEHVETFGITLNDPSKRGIGGVGTGGYGAFRTALLNPGTYTSVSAVDGPMDFNGADNNSGFIPMFLDAINEQGIYGGTSEPPDYETLYWVSCENDDTLLACICEDSVRVWEDSTYFICGDFDTTLDTAYAETLYWHACDIDSLLCECIDSMQIFDDVQYFICTSEDTLFDTTQFDPDTLVDTIPFCGDSALISFEELFDFISFGVVFVDTQIYCVDSSEIDYGDLSKYTTIDTLWPPSWRNNFDSLSSCPLSRLFIGGALAFSPHDTLIYTPTYNVPQIDSVIGVTDTMTLCPDVVGVDANDLDFHLPFDSLGQMWAPIWEGLWLPNNLESLLAADTSALRGVNIWIATSPEASLGYHGQTTSWITTLQNSNHAVTTMTYSGYAGSPASCDEYVYDLLKEILIFHSESFGE
jgi:hypothetical protein